MIRVAYIVALLISLVHASDAWAHASLVKSEPADGAVLAAPPSALTLTFNEPVSPLVMRLVGPTGVTFAPRSVVAENTTITIAGLPDLSSGTHVLSWRVISADGHPVGGALMFSIGAPSAQPTAAQRLADRTVRAGLWAVKLVIYVGLFVGVGGAFFRAWIADASFDAPARPLIAALLAGLVAVPLSVGLQGLDALDLPLAGLQEKAGLGGGPRDVLWPHGDRRGFRALCRPLHLRSAVDARGSRLVARRLARRRARACAQRPRQHRRPAARQPPGGVPARRLRRLLDRSAAAAVRACARRACVPGAALARFSRVIPLPLALLVVSGSWLAVVQLDRVDALWSTSYGQVLACKLAAVAVLLGLAAANRYWWVPKFEASRLESGGAAGARPLALSIACELIVALAILGLVALWRFTPPPRALAMAAPISIHVHGEKAMAQIEIERTSGQGGRANVLVLDGEYRPLAVKEVTLVLANPAAGIEPMRRAATPVGKGTWRIDDLRIPVAGRWNLRVEFLISDFDKLTIEDTVTLPRLP